jgi:hypothetical protein
MPDGPRHSHAAMQEKGAYNRHAQLQAGGAAMALPLLERAAQDLALEPEVQPIIIADYGSSQGKNSLAPMRAAIRILRQHLAPERPILVFHVDLPANDFNTLFAVLESDPDRYAQDEPNTFPCAIGRSFYEQVLPGESVHLGWCSYAAVWLSRIPMPIPGHFMVLFATAAVREAFARQAAQDWEAFLSLRARELRPGGRLVIVLPALDDDGSFGLEDLFNHANAVLADMVADGGLLAEERARMVLGAYPRRKCDLLAPSQQDGMFQRLVVESCEVEVRSDAAWAAFERHHDTDVLAAQHAGFFRSVFVPTLALGLRHAADAAACRAFGVRVEDGVKRRLASHPAPLHSFVGTMVLAKQGAAHAQ